MDLEIKAVPGASRDRVCGLLGDALKVQISAAAERGKANEGLEAFLAAAVGVRSQDVQVVKGHAAPRKTVRILGVTVEACRSRLLPNTAGAS